MKRLLISLLLAPVLAMASKSAPPRVSNPFRLGFYPLSSPIVPSLVKSLSNSVYEVRLPSQASTDVRWVDLSEASSLDPLLALKTQYKLDPLDLKIMQIQILACQKAEQRHCPVSLSSYRATGFSIGGSFWMSAHVIENYLREKNSSAALVKVLSGQELLPLYLFNSSGNLIFDPFFDRALVEKAPEPSERALARNAFYAEDTDHVILKLSRRLPSSLSWAAAGAVEGDSIYLLGYPSCTACRSSKTAALDARNRAPFSNSTGRGLHMTMGTVTSFDSASRFLNLPTAQLTMSGAEKILFFVGDSRQGMSGAPILNKNGLVVGIFAGGQSRMGREYVRLSRGVKILGPF